MGTLDRFGIGRLTASLSKTREGLLGRIRQLRPFTGKPDEEVLSQLEEILIAGDVGAGASSDMIAAIRREAQEKGGDLVDLLKREMTRQLSDGRLRGQLAADEGVASRPHVVMVVGINGVGKTTTIGKLSHRYVREGRSVLIAAADTFRAAANEQLEIWAQRAGARIITQRQGSDPAAVAFDAVSAACARAMDIVIIDTAGRLHTKVNLMEELKKIRRVIQKRLPGAPHEVLLVIDASTGQNGLRQAREFTDAAGVTGVVLTKLDGTAKGGIVLAIAKEFGLQVRFVGVGEEIGDLQPFDSAAFIQALFETGTPSE